MTKLSVNLNKVALIRNSRGEGKPDLLQFAKDCESYGADGITVHPRPDERHIRYDDVPKLKEVVTTELNVEGYPSDRFMDMVIKAAPDQCTLVPDPPGVLTSSEGWNVKKEKSFLTDIIARLKESGIRVSLFMETDLSMIDQAAEVGADRIELYTGGYARSFQSNKEDAVASHRQAGQHSQSIGIGLNAGHDLNLLNLHYYWTQVPSLLEVSIGHALISDALYFGIHNTVRQYKRQLSGM